MIKLLRIDERLIHGQVAVTWCSQLNIQRIVVANDNAATDAIQQTALKMAAPSGIKVAFKTVADAPKVLNDPRLEKFNVLLLVNSPKDALALLDTVNGIPNVNVGNFGLIEDGKKRKTIGYSINATDDEVEAFKQIAAKMPQSFYQMTPQQTPKLIADIF